MRILTASRGGRTLLLTAILGAGSIAQNQFGIEREMVPAGAADLIGAADFDGDGDLDLLTFSTGIYLNDGNARFTPHPVFSNVGVASANLVAIADFNGDGLPDLVAPGSLSGLSINTGGGVLVPVPGTLPALPAGPQVTCVAAGDVDGDGDRDLVIGRGGAPLVLWVNLGAATFVDASAQLPATTLHPRQMTLLDFDGDGDRDLLIANSSTGPVPPATGNRILMLNGGTGTFTTGWTSPGTGTAYDYFVTGDVNGDQLPDVAFYSNVVSIVVNTGTGFSGPSITGFAFPLLLDVNGDGSDELFAAAPSGGATLYPVSPAGVVSAALQTLGLFPQAAPIGGDFDGDGDRDMVLPTFQNHRVLLNTGQGLAEIPGYLSTPPMWERMHAGDLEGDGDVDLIGTYLNGIVVARNDGNGQLDWGPHMPCTGLCPAWAGNAVMHPFDADGDGDLDLYVVNGVSGPMPLGDRLMINTGSGFNATIPYSSAGTTLGGAIETGDVDGDGDQDLLVTRFPWQASWSLPVQLFTNLGSGLMSGPVNLPSASWTLDLKLVDVDGDGDLDLVEANLLYYNSVTSVLFLNNGAGAFSPVANFPGGPASYVQAGDLDGDGDADLLLDNRVVLNAGNGNFTPGAILAFPGSFYRTALLDADGDGDLDVLEGGRLYVNNGAASFAPYVVVSPQANWAAVADYDRDGDLDFVIPAPYPLLYTNRARQLVRGDVARPGRPASFDLRGPSLGTWTLFVSTGPAAIPLPPFGTVWIDPAPAIILGSGAFDTVGRGSWSTVVPTSPSFVGQSFFLQAVVFGGPVPKLTGREITTVATY